MTQLQVGANLKNTPPPPRPCAEQSWIFGAICFKTSCKLLYPRSMCEHGRSLPRVDLQKDTIFLQVIANAQKRLVRLLLYPPGVPRGKENYNPTNGPIVGTDPIDIPENKQAGTPVQMTATKRNPRYYCKHPRKGHNGFDGLEKADSKGRGHGPGHPIHLVNLKANMHACEYSTYQQDSSLGHLRRNPLSYQLHDHVTNCVPLRNACQKPFACHPVPPAHPPVPPPPHMQSGMGPYGDTDAPYLWQTRQAQRRRPKADAEKHNHHHVAPNMCQILEND